MKGLLLRECIKYGISPNEGLKFIYKNSKGKKTFVRSNHSRNNINFILRCLQESSKKRKCKKIDEINMSKYAHVATIE